MFERDNQKYRPAIEDVAKDVYPIICDENREIWARKETCIIMSFIYDIIIQQYFDNWDVMIMLTGPNSASRICQIRMSIRCRKELSYTILTDIFKKKTIMSKEYHNYLYGFFEECYPSLIKRYMVEQNISRDEIISIFNLLPDSGEKWKFRKALSNGEF